MERKAQRTRATEFWLQCLSPPLATSPPKKIKVRNHHTKARCYGSEMKCRIQKALPAPYQLARIISSRIYQSQIHYSIIVFSFYKAPTKVSMKSRSKSVYRSSPSSFPPSVRCNSIKKGTMASTDRGKSLDADDPLEFP